MTTIQHGCVKAILLTSFIALTACGGSSGDSKQSPTLQPEALNPSFFTPVATELGPDTRTTPSAPPSGAAQPQANWVAPHGVTGSVRNVLNTENLAGVQVEVYDSAQLNAGGAIPMAASFTMTPVLTVFTDANGQFITGALNLEGYPVFRYYLENYLNTIVHYDVPAPDVTETQPLQVEPTRMPTEDEANGTPDIGGTITNALTGQVVANATVKLYLNGNTTLEPDYTLITDSTGRYTQTAVSAGTYAAVISAEGYVTTRRNTLYAYVGASNDYDEQNQNLNFTITPVMAADQWRVVLTWGEHPHDLDSHMWAPSSTSDVDSCGNGTNWEADKHIYYSHKKDNANTLNLDVDDVTSYGPETITITSQQEGTYYYSIHHFSGDKSIAESGAKIELYKGSELKRTFFAPTTGGENKRVWDVFNLNGDTITTVNGYRANVTGCPR